jgi:hypothetical protein
MIIASRTLILRNGSTAIEIPVRIFSPECEKSKVWGCRYEIGWPDANRSVTAWGVDSVQALVIALGMIGAEIYSSNYHKAGALFWDKPGNGYGFPVAPSIRDLLQGDDTKYF